MDEVLPIDLHLVGKLRAGTGAVVDVLPSLRKARALFVVLALSERQSASRRFLAGLLWSRNDQAQALARLRDTLSALRAGLRHTLGGIELLQLDGDYIGLRPNAVRPILDLENAHPGEIAADLSGIDPAFDDWLDALRARLLSAPRPTAPQARSMPKRGSVIGVCVMNTLGMPGEEYMAVALAEEIATALSRVRGLIVISSGSVAASLAAQRDPRRDLGVDFLLDGALLRLGNRVRVTVKLVDAESGAVCWTSHSDYSDGNLFQMQEDVAALVAAGLEPELPMIAAERMRRTGTMGDEAYPTLLRAISMFHLLDRRSFMEAGELLGRAISLEPDFSPAYSWYALWLAFLVGQGWARDPRATILRAGEAAEHAVLLDPNDARGLTVAGHVRAFLHRRLDEALPLHERAIAINPSLPLAWHFSGVAHVYKGDLDEARRRLERCRALAPRDPHSFFVEGAMIILELLSRNHREAALIGRRVTQLHPRFSAAFKPYLSALGHLGEAREAALIHERLLALEPDFSVRAFRATSPFAVREHLDHYLAGLTLAGVA